MWVRGSRAPLGAVGFAAARQKILLPIRSCGFQISDEPDRRCDRRIGQTEHFQMLGISDVSLFQGFLEMILAFSQFTDCDVQLVRELRRPESSEAFGNVARGRRRRPPDLIAKPEVTACRRFASKCKHPPLEFTR